MRPTEVVRLSLTNRVQPRGRYLGVVYRPWNLSVDHIWTRLLRQHAWQALIRYLQAHARLHKHKHTHYAALMGSGAGEVILQILQTNYYRDNIAGVCAYQHTHRV